MRKAFTLIELLVAITVISLLFGILVPALSMAMKLAKTAFCASNLRSVAVATHMYASESGGTFMAASEFANGQNNRDGYKYWSAVLVDGGYLQEKALLCPSLANGGLPPANPADGDQMAGQCPEVAGAVDIAPARCAYALNESVFAKFCVSNPRRASRLVNADWVSPGTILATELPDDWTLLANGSTTCRSYLPVHGFYVKAASATDKYNLNAAGNPHKPCLKNGPFTRVCDYQIQGVPDADRKNPSPIDFIGRNHGAANEGGFRKSNFAFIDGHVEDLHVDATIATQQWGQRVYSITGDNRVY